MPGTPSDFARLDAIAEDHTVQLASIKKQLDENTRLTAMVQENTSDLVAGFNNLRGFWAVLEFIGKLAKPLGWISAACAAFYLSFKLFGKLIIEAVSK